MSTESLKLASCTDYRQFQHHQKVFFIYLTYKPCLVCFKYFIFLTFCHLLTDEGLDVEMADEDAVPVKKQKVLERCKFWPVCKSGDECLYHHPTTQCKLVPGFKMTQRIRLFTRVSDEISYVLFFFRTFPNCKFGDKCLFVHPNCKYDARCTKPDCPFTHVSRRGAAAPPPRPGNFQLTVVFGQD